MGGQRPGPYDRPMISGPRGGFFGPGPGRGGSLMEPMRSGGGYGGGKIYWAVVKFVSRPASPFHGWWISSCPSLVGPGYASFDGYNGFNNYSFGNGMFDERMRGERGGRGKVQTIFSLCQDNV